MFRKAAATLLLMITALPVYAQSSVTLPSFGPPRPKPVTDSTTPPRQTKTAPSVPSTPPPQTHKEGELGFSGPPPRGTWRLVLQSVAVRVDGKTQYSSFYYDASTGQSIDHPAIPLPVGGFIVGVFPDDCTFRVQDQAGRSFTFKDEKEAKGKTLGPGTWSLFPIKCGGVALFVK